MKLNVQPVLPQDVHTVWSLAAGFLLEALEYSDKEYTLDQVRLLLAQGSWELIVAADETGIIHGACTVSYTNSPNWRVAFVTLMGGKLISSKDTYAQLCTIVKSRGATRIHGAARDSVVRLWRRYGFTEKHTIVEAIL